MPDTFDAEKAIADARKGHGSAASRPINMGRSGLDRYRQELVEMLEAGARVCDLQRHILKRKRRRFSYSTIWRWVQKNG